MLIVKLPSFILEGSFSDHEIAPNDITIIKTSKYAKKPNHEQVFFDSHFLDQNISCSELNDESISSNSNDTNEEEDVPNSINYFFDSKKLNDSTLFQKISFFEKDQKLWNQFGNNKINMNVCFKDGNDDKIINPNTIKDINDENCLPDLKSKEDMDKGYKGTLNDFTQNFNNININNAFKNLFQARSHHLRPTSRNTRQVSHCSPFLTHAQSLACIPPLAEILRNLRELPPLKALGPDGYHALFFQQNWSSLGPSIIQVIQEIFEQLTIPSNWGLTNLVLIPKVAHPDLITQF